MKYKKRLDKKSFSKYVQERFSISISEYKNLVKGGCAVCGSKKRIHLHHKIPLMDGGLNDISNFEPLCFHHHAEIHPWMKKQKCSRKNSFNKDFTFKKRKKSYYPWRPFPFRWQ